MGGIQTAEPYILWLDILTTYVYTLMILGRQLAKHPHKMDDFMKPPVSND